MSDTRPASAFWTAGQRQDRRCANMLAMNPPAANSAPSPRRFILLPEESGMGEPRTADPPLPADQRRSALRVSGGRRDGTRSLASSAVWADVAPTSRTDLLGFPRPARARCGRAG